MRFSRALGTVLLSCVALLGVTGCASSDPKWQFTDAKKGLTSDLYPCPENEPVKGNKNAKKRLFHTADSPWYRQTNPEECFATTDAAKDAGYNHW